MPDTTEKAFRPRRATSRSLVKEIALQYAKDTRPFARFTRVSASFLDDVEARCMSIIRSKVDQHPTKGQTLQ